MYTIQVYNTTNACIMYLGLLRGCNDLTATTVGVWHQIVIQTRACLWSMDSIFSLAFYA